MILPDELDAARGRLKAWLLEAAYPIWWDVGADHSGGGFHDRLNLDGTPQPGLKRLRVQARQAWAFALAEALGWRGPGADASRHGLDFVRTWRTAGGLYRLAPRPADAPLDGMGELYDQAFVMLALAVARPAAGAPTAEVEARALRERLADFADPLGGYAEAPGVPAPLFANPNMHLFEAYQAWAANSVDPMWAAEADRLGDLALTHLIDPRTGALAESFGPGWSLPAPPERWTIWPGHLFEWAWLLLRWRGGDPATRAAALRLVDVAEAHGVDPARKVAIYALDDELAPVDSSARLWSQTERIKATALAASLTGRPELWDAARQACEGLERFFEVPTRGLWRDRMLADGSFAEEAAPASSFYHIVGAITELERLATVG